MKRFARVRETYVREAFREPGTEGDDLEMRSHLFVCYHTFEHVMYSDASVTRLRRLWRRRLELLLSRK